MFIIQIALAFPVYPASYKHSIMIQGKQLWQSISYGFT